METGGDWSDAADKPRNIRSYQKLEEARKDFGSLESMALLPPQFWTSDLLNCEKINFYYFKAPSLW